MALPNDFRSQQFHGVFNIAQLLAAHKTKGYDGYALILSTSLQYENSKQQTSSGTITNNVSGEKENPLRNLQGVLNDAEKIRAYLLQHKFKDKKTGKVYQVKVKDAWVQRSAEGGKEMCRAIQDFFECDYNVFILYYTGHGARQTGNWSIYKEDKAASDFISLDDLLQLWEGRRKACKCCCCPHKCKCGRKKTKSSHLIIIADSCFSGAWVETLNTYHQSGNFKTVSMVASCRNFQTCGDTATGDTFTKYLVGEVVQPPDSQIPQYTADIRQAFLERTSSSSFLSLFQCCVESSGRYQVNTDRFNRLEVI